MQISKMALNEDINQILKLPIMLLYEANVGADSLPIVKNMLSKLNQKAFGLILGQESNKK
jgi:hypothetical protein